MPNSAWDNHPDHTIIIHLHENPVSIKFRDVILAHSTNALRLNEQDYPAVYYFPRDDVRMDLLQQSSKVTHCPFKGDANHWSLEFEGQVVEVAAWSYAEPYKQVDAIKDYIAFYPEVIESFQEN